MHEPLNNELVLLDLHDVKTRRAMKKVLNALEINNVSGCHQIWRSVNGAKGWKPNHEDGVRTHTHTSKIAEKRACEKGNEGAEPMSERAAKRARHKANAAARLKANIDGKMKQVKHARTKEQA